MGPKAPHSTVMSAEEEPVAVAFRKHTLPPLGDDPHLTRSALHRYFQRHGISQLPETLGDKAAKKTFKRYPLGYFHIDIAEVRAEEGKLHLFVAVDRTSKYAFARLVKRDTGMAVRAFLEELLAAATLTKRPRSPMIWATALAPIGDMLSATMISKRSAG